jgi:hypothetical protein
MFADTIIVGMTNEPGQSAYSAVGSGPGTFSAASLRVWPFHPTQQVA